jgi:hypothetical protein
MKNSIRLASIAFAMCFAAVLSSCEPKDPPPGGGDETLAVPTELKVGNVTDVSASLSWSGEATTYEVSVDGADAVTIKAKTFTATGLTPETTYEWQVRAKDGELFSDWVDGEPFTTGEDVPSYDMVISDIANLPAEAVTVKAVVNVATEDDVPVVLASDNVEDGVATLYLIETIDSEYLMPMADVVGYDEGVELSDPAGKFTQVGFMVCDMADQFIGALILTNDEEVETALMYADRPYTVITTNEDDWDIWNLDFVKGYNWTQIYDLNDEQSTMTNGYPDDATWYYFSPEDF